MDLARLTRLGFHEKEIYEMQYVWKREGKITMSVLRNYGFSADKAAYLKYMYDIATGKIYLGNEQSLTRHFKRLNGSVRKTDISDFPYSSVKDVPRIAVVAGIKQSPFTIYNSDRYTEEKKMYRVMDVTSKGITVITGRKPRISHGTPRKVNGVLEIKELRKDGSVKIMFDSKVCKLCNRFIIVGGLRRPEYHHGMIVILCDEGTKAYVYARTLNPSENVGRHLHTQRVYGCGYLVNQIPVKLRQAAGNVYRQLHGMGSRTVKGNTPYRILSEQTAEPILTCNHEFDTPD